MRTVTVKVIPRSKKNCVDVQEGGAVVVRTTAVPEDGKATAAVAALLAAHFGVAKSRVRIVRGHTSRHKTYTID